MFTKLFILIELLLGTVIQQRNTLIGDEFEYILDQLLLETMSKLCFYFHQYLQ